MSRSSDRSLREPLQCRCCGACVVGPTDARFPRGDRAAWRRIARIKGPNAACPACAHDPRALDGLRRDGYLDAVIVEDR